MQVFRAGLWSEFNHPQWRYNSAAKAAEMLISMNLDVYEGRARRNRDLQGLAREIRAGRWKAIAVDWHDRAHSGKTIRREVRFERTGIGYVLISVDV